MKKIIFITLTAMLTYQSATADSFAEEIVNPSWSGEIKFGGVLNSGNSDNKNLNGKLVANYKTLQWNNNFSLEGQLNTSEGKTNAANLLAKGDLHYALNEYDYLFSKASAKFDQFASFDRTFNEAIGYGRYFIKNDMTTLTVEAGPGGNHSRVSGAENYITQFIFNIGSELTHKLTDSSQIKLTINNDIGKEYTHIRFDSSIKTKLTEALGLELGFTTTHDTKIPFGSKNKQKTDTITKISVVFEF